MPLIEALKKLLPIQHDEAKQALLAMMNLGPATIKPERRPSQDNSWMPLKKWRTESAENIHIAIAKKYKGGYQGGRGSRFKTFQIRLDFFALNHVLDDESLSLVFFGPEPTNEEKCLLKDWRQGNADPKGAQAIKLQKNITAWLMEAADFSNERAKLESMWLLRGGPSELWTTGSYVRVLHGGGYEDMSEARFHRESDEHPEDEMVEVPYYEGRLDL